MVFFAHIAKILDIDYWINVLICTPVLCFSTILIYQGIKHVVWAPNFHRPATWYESPVSDTDFGDYWGDTAVVHFDTDFIKTTENLYIVHTHWPHLVRHYRTEETIVVRLFPIAGESDGISPLPSSQQC